MALELENYNIHSGISMGDNESKVCFFSIYILIKQKMFFLKFRQMTGDKEMVTSQKLLVLK